MQDIELSEEQVMIREMGYRDKALKMYPHVCGRCAREFAGKRLSELTVHHRDHNHDNNPQDGMLAAVESLSGTTAASYHGDHRLGGRLREHQQFWPLRRLPANSRAQRPHTWGYIFRALSR